MPIQQISQKVDGYGFNVDYFEFGKKERVDDPTINVHISIILFYVKSKYPDPCPVSQNSFYLKLWYFWEWNFSTFSKLFCLYCSHNIISPSPLCLYIYSLTSYCLVVTKQYFTLREQTQLYRVATDIIIILVSELRK